jgi:hypothetical protein
MKTLLKISVFSNALLLLALGTSLARREKLPAPVVIPAVSMESNASSQIQSVPPFHWSQLESTNDYRFYIANLRAVGCPETTIRAIVCADFEAAARFEQHQLELAGRSPAMFSPEATKQAIDRALGTELDSSLADETVQAASSISLSRGQTSNLRPVTQATARASYPVVFQNAVMNDSSLTENQKAAVRQLQQQFVDAVGDQSPSDPAYRARWQTAQQNADEVLRAQLGDQAYNSYKLQHYYSNFQQVMLRAPDGGVTINSEELAQ